MDPYNAIWAHSNRLRLIIDLQNPETRIKTIKLIWLQGLEVFREDYLDNRLPSGTDGSNRLMNLTSVASAMDNSYENPIIVNIKGITVMGIEIDGMRYLWKPRLFLLLNNIKKKMETDGQFFDQFFEDLITNFPNQDGEICF